MQFIIKNLIDPIITNIDNYLNDQIAYDATVDVVDATTRQAQAEKDRYESDKTNLNNYINTLNNSISESEPESESDFK